MTMVVGLTGGVAVGKSTVSAMLAQFGAIVLDADVVARLVVEPGTPGLAEITRYFGEQILQPDGSLDRRALGKIVFADAAARTALEAIVHPQVFAWLRSKLAEVANSAAPLVVLDIPLLFETRQGLSLCQKTIVVWAPEQTQLKRLMLRDGLREEEARQRIRAQMPLSEKVKLADYIVDNSGTLSATKDQVKHLWDILTSRSTL